MCGVDVPSVSHGEVKNEYFKLKILDDGCGVESDREWKSGGCRWRG